MMTYRNQQDKNLYADHFQPFITELQSFIERKVHVIFGRLAPYSNFDYKNENEQMTSSRWENMCFGYLEERRAEGSNGPTDQSAFSHQRKPEQQDRRDRCITHRFFPEIAQLHR